jgi:hypothetical protein
MKKSIPPYEKHANHTVEIRTTHFHNGYYYMCSDCLLHLGWLSKQEVAQAKSLGLTKTNDTSIINK